MTSVDDDGRATGVDPRGVRVEKGRVKAWGMRSSPPVPAALVEKAQQERRRLPVRREPAKTPITHPPPEILIIKSGENLPIKFRRELAIIPP
jgi:hypothetical protein